VNRRTAISTLALAAAPAIAGPVGLRLPSNEFNPMSVSGMAAWWAARKETGFSNNDAVGTVTDWTGNGLTLTQSTGSKKPLFLTGQKNGQPAFAADGVDDFLTGGDILDVGTGSIHFFFVAKFDSVSGTCVGMSKSLLAAGSGLYDALSVYTSAWHVFFEFPAATNNPVTSGTPDTGWHLFEFVVNRDSGFVELWVDGTQLGTDAVSAGDGNNASRLLMFAYSGDGADTSETFFMQGKIAEVWCWQRVLTAGERSTLRAGANSLYAIY